MEIVTTTLNNMELSVGKGDLTQAISAWSFNPATGDIASYTFQYELYYQNGSTAPTWTFIDGSDLKVDDAQTPATGSYDLRLIGTAIDQDSNILTDRYN